MNFLHSRIFVNNNQAVIVNCNYQCNILLLDDNNFNNYKNRRRYSYDGGFYTKFPALLQPHSLGHWNIVLDIGGGQATIQYNIKIINL